MKAVASKAGVDSVVVAVWVKAPRSTCWVEVSPWVKAVASKAGVDSVVVVWVKAPRSKLGERSVVWNSLVLVCWFSLAKLVLTWIGFGSTNSWVKFTFDVVVVVVVCVVVKASVLKAELVSTAGVVSAKLVFILKSFKAEVAPTIELLEVKSKLFVLVSKAGVVLVIAFKSTFGSIDWKVSAL